jgi:hypothetical protein
MPTTPSKDLSPLPRTVFFSLLDTLFVPDKEEKVPAEEDKTRFKLVCDTKKDSNGNLIFGTKGSTLRQGEFYSFVLSLFQQHEPSIKNYL